MSRSARARMATWAESWSLSPKRGADQFLVGDDVVLVEDGDDVFVREQMLDAALDVAVELAAVEVEVGEQHLRDADAGAAEGLVVEAHQARLAERGAGLQLGHGGGALFQAEQRHAAADRAGADDEHLVAAPAQLDDLRGELLDLAEVDLAAGIGENAGAELDHPALGAPAGRVAHSGIRGRNSPVELEGLDQRGRGTCGSASSLLASSGVSASMIFAAA